MSILLLGQCGRRWISFGLAEVKTMILNDLLWISTGQT
jgi:hypothetical protein